VLELQQQPYPISNPREQHNETLTLNIQVSPEMSFLSFFLAFSKQTYFPHTPPATPPQIKTLKKKVLG
jgi:hypothetical protein